MTSKQHLICINCPKGCRLEVEYSADGGWLVEGNQCKRGVAYAIKELTDPVRVLPTTMKIRNGFLHRLPVRTDAALPKEKIFEAMAIINQKTVDAPIHMGDIIIENILDTGVNVIASRSMQTSK